MEIDHRESQNLRGLRRNLSRAFDKTFWSVNVDVEGFSSLCFKRQSRPEQLGSVK